MSEKKPKTVKEIFNDYKTNSNIKEANIEGLDVSKKINRLSIKLKSDEYIEIKEIWYLEKFLMERFKFASIQTIIKYTDDVKLKSIEEEWENIICYMTHKYPLMRPMLLLKSKIEIIENNINVMMQIKGADFLKARKLDKELEQVIKNIFNKDYKINIEEKIKKEDVIAIQEKTKQIEKQAIEHAMEEIHKNDNIPYNDSDYQMPSDIDEPYIAELEQLDEEENNIILGKMTKVKENKKKIKDITAEDGKITLEGRIVNCECRETKTGKGMIIFELYDGTGVITCKSFAKDAQEGNQVVE